MDEFTRSVTECQVDSLTACVRRVIDDLAPYVGDGLHRPVVLNAEFGNRVEILCLLHGIQKRRTAVVRARIEPRELARTLEDTQPHGCLYIPGDILSHALQRRVVAKYTDEIARHTAPPTFIVLTHVHPDSLTAQHVWRTEFRALFGDRIVTLPSAEDRRPEELVELFAKAVRRAAESNKKRFKIDRGALELLTLTWAKSPPPSLEFVVAVANKAVADATAQIEKIAREVVSKQQLHITGKEIVDALMPDCPLATSAPSSSVR
jgi:hypothetical protein